MLDSLYYQYNPWWEAGYRKMDVFPRPRLRALWEKELQSKGIVMLVGLRRVGKTTQLHEIVDALLAQGVSAQHILYISLDDYQLQEYSILDVVAHYRKLQRLPADQHVYLLLDEITCKDHFQQQLKNLYDQGHAKVFVSSSSSSALRDKRGYLTGRQTVIEVAPLDFEEYLIFKKIHIKKRDQALLDRYFEDYLQTGGMPEFVLTGRREYLVELVNDILYKDIVAFHGLRRPQLIRDYFALLMERAGKQISVNKIAKVLKISVDTANRYLEMFVDAYLIYLVPRYGKANEVILSPKKVYAADLGIRNLFTGFRDKGAVFENVVFSTIKHLGPRYVYQNGVELDFMTQDEKLIEVKYHRELEGKQKALFESFPAKEKIVIQNVHDLVFDSFA